MSSIEIEEQAKKFLPTLFERIQNDFDWNRIGRYQDFLIRQNERGGFFSKNDAAVIFERHILDCLLFVWKLKEEGLVSRETKVADVGTGPGLPGFIFLCLKQLPSVILIDSQRRKLFLLEEEVMHGNLSEVKDRITFSYERAEDMKAKFDVVTSRAVVPYPFMIEVASNLVKRGGVLCPYLGQLRFDDSVEKRVLQYSGFHIKKEIELSELDFLGKRHIKILQKDSDTKPGYPRLWKDIVKETKQANG